MEGNLSAPGPPSTSAYNLTSTAPEDSGEILTIVGHSATAALAILSLFLNTLVIVVILHQRRRRGNSVFAVGPALSSRKREPGQIHLLCLAVSDMSLAGFVVAGGIWLWTSSEDATPSTSSSLLQRALSW